MTHRRRSIRLLTGAIAFLTLTTGALAAAPGEPVVRVYGPGGPEPAIREAAEVFGRAHSVRVEVVAGPTPKWIARAKADADVIYSGAEFMMSDFIRDMEGRIEEDSVTPLYLRPSAILVRPGNPKKITGLEDLLKPAMKVLVVQGAGQTGLWEDVAGRRGNIRTVRAFRRNIVFFAANSAEARARWNERKEIDAWLIWNIWETANPDLADVVPLSEEDRIYRDCGVALTRQGKAKAPAREFVDFLQSREGERIFARWGWITETKEGAQTGPRPTSGGNPHRIVLEVNTGELEQWPFALNNVENVRTALGPDTAVEIVVH